jgi:hypothetical protein
MIIIPRCLVARVVSIVEDLCQVTGFIYGGQASSSTVSNRAEAKKKQIQRHVGLYDSVALGIGPARAVEHCCRPCGSYDF